MASLHDPGAHEQDHVNANRLVVQSTGRMPRRALPARRKGGRRLSDEQDDARVGGVQSSFAS